MKRGCRILALLTDGPGAAGGIARYNRSLLAALARCEEVAEVVALPRYGHAHRALPRKIVECPAVATKVGWSLAAARLATSRQFDVVFCGHLNALPLAALLATAIGARLWAQVHGIEAWEAGGWLVHRSLERAALVTSVSRFTRRRLLAWSGIAPDRVRVLPNALDETFAPRARRADLVRHHGLAARRVILTIGRLAAAERYKGHDRLIRVLSRIAEACPDAIYLVVGAGDDLARLEHLARSGGVRERVRFAGGVPDAELPDYLALADVFAMPSTGEGFGIVFLEAAASGLPVIGGDCDGSRDALADGEIGRLVDPRDEERLVAAVVEALLRSGCATTAASEAVGRFAFENFAGHVDDLVSSLFAR